METMAKRVLDRIENLVIDVGRWEIAVTVLTMDEPQQAYTSGSMWLIRNGTDVVDGQLLYKIDHDAAEVELWTTELTNEARAFTQLFESHCRYTVGESLHNMFLGLELALDQFPKEGDIVE